MPLPILGPIYVPLIIRAIIDRENFAKIGKKEFVSTETKTNIYENNATAIKKTLICQTSKRPKSRYLHYKNKGNFLQQHLKWD